MSSPVTVEYTLAESLAEFAADAVAEIRNIRNEYEVSNGAAIEAAMATARKREMKRREHKAARHEAAARLVAIRQEADALIRRIARLAALDGETPTLPTMPHDADTVAWSAYLLALEGIENTLHTRAAVQADASVRAALATLEQETPQDTLADILAFYFAQRRARRVAEGKPTHDETWQATVTRILARLELTEGAPVPERLEALARAVILAESPERAELLGNELRLQVHLHQQEEAARRQDASDAERWLTLFEAELPAALRSRLEAVAAGLSRLETAERQELAARETALAAERETARNRAAALVLEASLEDLGYQVEGIGETLFSTDGITHFQRPGWGDYYVRLRVNVQNGTFNFNVVRAGNRGEAQADSGAQKREDLMAEERWCAEFPRLMATLAARELELKVTRRIEAGELPVQIVTAERLPRFSAPATGKRGRPLAKRHLPQ
ncbi:MAG: hypothetical protein LBB76_10385 [Azoarcus sp.]|nr:hypothetical protein [Azoarcus sp.]